MGTGEEAPAPMVDPLAVAEGAAGVVALQEGASASSAASQVQHLETPAWPIHVWEQALVSRAALCKKNRRGIDSKTGGLLCPVRIDCTCCQTALPIVHLETHCLSSVRRVSVALQRCCWDSELLCGSCRDCTADLQTGISPRHGAEPQVIHQSCTQYSVTPALRD